MPGPALHEQSESQGPLVRVPSGPHKEDDSGTIKISARLRGAVVPTRMIEGGLGITDLPRQLARCAITHDVPEGVRSIALLHDDARISIVELDHRPSNEILVDLHPLDHVHVTVTRSPLGFRDHNKMEVRLELSSFASGLERRAYHAATSGILPMQFGHLDTLLVPLYANVGGTVALSIVGDSGGSEVTLRQPFSIASRHVEFDLSGLAGWTNRGHLNVVMDFAGVYPSGEMWIRLEDSNGKTVEATQCRRSQEQRVEHCFKGIVAGRYRCELRTPQRNTYSSSWVDFDPERPTPVAFTILANGRMRIVLPDLDEATFGSCGPVLFDASGSSVGREMLRERDGIAPCFLIDHLQPGRYLVRVADEGLTRCTPCIALDVAEGECQVWTTAMEPAVHLELEASGSFPNIPIELTRVDGSQCWACPGRRRNSLLIPQGQYTLRFGGEVHGLDMRVGTQHKLRLPSK